MHMSKHTMSRLSAYHRRATLTATDKASPFLFRLRSYKALAQHTKEDARTQFMRILRTLPYGNATFFAVRRIEDPIGLLPPRLILGINKRGVHFFRPVPKEYLHSAELRDIMQVRLCIVYNSMLV